jgi:hypothetical protein
MILLATKVLTIGTVAALATGFGLAAIIRTADRVQKEEILHGFFPLCRASKWQVRGKPRPELLQSGFGPNWYE